MAATTNINLLLDRQEQLHYLSLRQTDMRPLGVAKLRRCRSGGATWVKSG